MKNILLVTMIFAFAGVYSAHAQQDFSIPLEGNGGYIDFDDDSRFRDTWYVGGATGFDFSENAGIRGYYWRALDDGQIDEFDNLEIYGAESKVKVPITNSIKPYLVVGGGLLKPFDNYIDDNGNIENDDHFFGSAGAGLDLNFIRFLSVTGYARAMFSDFQQINTLDNDVTTSWNYGASLNFNLFDNKRKTESSSSTIVMPEPKTKSEDAAVEPKDIDKYKSEIEALEERIEQLEEKEKEREMRKEIESELRKEFEDKYNKDINQIKEEKIIKKRMKTTDTMENDQQSKKDNSSQADTISEADEESKAELRAMEEKMLAFQEKMEKQQEQVMRLRDSLESVNEVRKENYSELQKRIEDKRAERLAAQKQMEREFEKFKQVKDREIKDLEQQIQELQTKRENYSGDNEELTAAMDENLRLLKELREQQEEAYEEQNETFENQLRELKKDQNNRLKDIEDEIQQTNRVNRDYLKNLRQELTAEEYETVIEEVQLEDEQATVFNRMIYQEALAFLGGSFGDASGLNFGIRPSFYITGSKLKFAPEVSFTPGNSSNFSLFGNALFDLEDQTEKKYDPYAGAGLGFIVPDGEFKPAFNVLVGSEVDIQNMDFNVEFATRNAFKYNQLNLGYYIR